jgi:hypothetical protein
MRFGSWDRFFRSCPMKSMTPVLALPAGTTNQCGPFAPVPVFLNKQASEAREKLPSRIKTQG